MGSERIFAEIDELTASLTSAGRGDFASSLKYRLHKVSWTSATELLENLASSLAEYLQAHENDLEAFIADKIKSILNDIEFVIRR